MKEALLLLWMLANSLIYAQSAKVEAILDKATQARVATFDPMRLHANQLFVPLPYAGSKLKNFPDYLTKKPSILRIELVYSDYPRHNEPWQRKLNKHRLLELTKYCPAALEVSIENWKLTAQTQCRSEQEARALPHGFIFTLNNDFDKADFTDGESLRRHTKGDSTVLNTFQRNQQWKKMLVVTDLTGSMSPYTAQLLLWYKLAQNTGRVKYLVFFNDGDNKSDKEKELGNTGGVYGQSAGSFDEIAALANKVINNGSGGDDSENNVEALLFGIEKCSDCEEVIMIADNWATPRDLALLKKVNKPVRVILCGTEDGINSDYLNVARQTQGSVHTIEEDIYNLLEMNEGQELKIGKDIFVVRNGKFELFKRI